MFEYVVVDPFDDLTGQHRAHGEVVPEICAQTHPGHVVRRLAAPAPAAAQSAPASEER
jgi:hypothetical protein